MADSDETTIHAHSVQEEYFYMMVNPCDCGGAWFPADQQIERGDDRVAHRIEAKCSRCGKERTFPFELPGEAHPDGPTQVREINATDEPSRAVDLAQWLDLAEFYLTRIEKLKDNVRKAQSLLDARLCLEEALKFYGPDDAEPPAEALWSKASRKKARRQADTFRRETIEKMLERIPPKEKLERVDAPVQKQFESGLRAEAGRRARDRWKFWKRWGRRE